MILCGADSHSWFNKLSVCVVCHDSVHAMSFTVCSRDSTLAGCASESSDAEQAHSDGDWSGSAILGVSTTVYS